MAVGMVRVENISILDFTSLELHFCTIDIFIYTDSTFDEKLVAKLTT